MNNKFRRVVASVLTAVALGGSVAGLAFAVFSDSASIAGNTISTGNIDISIGGDGPEQTPTPIVAQGLMPGDWTDWYRYMVSNDSNVNTKLYFYVTDVYGDACTKTNLEIRTGVKDGDESQYQVYNSGLELIKGVNNKVEVTGYVFDPTMMPGDVAVVKMRAGLDLSATNNESTETCTWTGVFFAEGSNEEQEPPMSFPVSFPEMEVEE